MSDIVPYGSGGEIVNSGFALLTEIVSSIKEYTIQKDRNATARYEITKMAEVAIREIEADTVKFIAALDKEHNATMKMIDYFGQLILKDDLDDDMKHLANNLLITISNAPTFKLKNQNKRR